MLIRTAAPPSVEPVSVEEAKAEWRIDGSDEDAVVARLLAAARERIETATGRRLITQSLVGMLDTWPAALGAVDEGAPIVAAPPGSAAFVEIPVAPIASVTSVNLLDEDDVASEWASANWYLSRGSGWGRLVRRAGASWPAPLRAVGGIEIAFVAGYGATGADVPFALREAILRLGAFWYENREAGGVVPREVWSLISKFWRLRIG